jgi:hypothetical protein
MEDEMSAPKSLKSLTFAVLPKREANPVQERRNKTIARLEEQKSLFDDPSFTRMVRTSVKGDDGARTTVEKAATYCAMVGHACRWLLPVHHPIRLEAHRSSIR